MKNIILLGSLICLNIIAFAQKNNSSVITQTLYVKGNCGQCKERIESAVDVKGVKYAEWNKKTRTLTITYKPSVITIETIQNLILKAGHDVDSLKAKDDVYQTLPDCCKYRDVAPH